MVTTDGITLLKKREEKLKNTKSLRLKKKKGTMAYKAKNREVKSSAREDNRSWLQEHARMSEGAAKSGRIGVENCTAQTRR